MQELYIHLLKPAHLPPGLVALWLRSQKNSSEIVSSEGPGPLCSDVPNSYTIHSIHNDNSTSKLRGNLGIRHTGTKLHIVASKGINCQAFLWCTPAHAVLAKPRNGDLIKKISSTPEDLRLRIPEQQG